MKSKIQAFKIRPGMGIILFSLVLLLFISSCSPSENNSSINLTGTWQTESMVPFLIEYSSDRPEGKPITLEGIQLLERYLTLTWALTQRSDGLLTGTNSWVSHNDKGEELYKDFEPMVGVMSGKRIVLVEGQDKESPQVVFECSPDGSNRLNCIGYDAGGLRAFATRFVLVRDH